MVGVESGVFVSCAGNQLKNILCSGVNGFAYGVVGRNRILEYNILRFCTFLNFSQPAGRRSAVLVVDDEPSVRESTAMFLAEAGGYEVSTAQHGLDALSQLKTPPPPDVIVSDLNMPQMSGFEFLSAVRQSFPGIPVLAFSGAYPSGDAVPDGVLADAFLTKGEDPIKLLDTVAGLIQVSLAVNFRRQSTPIPTPSR